MHRARWSDLMAGWNSLTRHRKRQEGRGVSSSSTADSYREEEHHDFLLDQEAGIEGGQRMIVLGVRGVLFGCNKRVGTGYCCAVYCWCTAGVLLVYCWGTAGVLLVYCWSCCYPALTETKHFHLCTDALYLTCSSGSVEHCEKHSGGSGRQGRWRRHCGDAVGGKAVDSNASSEIFVRERA
jgi:hypothetical protein